ncbi:hypothetical protein LJK88_44345 [Paenibacillus sp. P26]|nr:hypothetical protein LJK88_44345 [Paenibacillus sp. P26]
MYWLARLQLLIQLKAVRRNAFDRIHRFAQIKRFAVQTGAHRKHLLHPFLLLGVKRAHLADGYAAVEPGHKIAAHERDKGKIKRRVQRKRVRPDDQTAYQELRLVRQQIHSRDSGAQYERRQLADPVPNAAHPEGIYHVINAGGDIILQAGDPVG